LRVNKCIKDNSKKEWSKQKDSLSSIQKALDNLLEEKRSAFPRFYFLSNDELLEILAKAGDLESIQRNIKKCFDGVHKFIISEHGRNIEGM
jgi:dynein heavy chain, axonemal